MKQIPSSYYEVKDCGYKTPCWVWIRAALKSGYGVIYRGTGRHDQKTTTAHRAMYEQEIGPIPPGLFPDHLCRNRPCVNPQHLELVTNAENQRRGAAAKLDWEKVAEIRNLHAQGGWTHRRLADRYGVRPPAITVLLNGKTWKEDERPSLHSAPSCNQFG